MELNCSGNSQKHYHEFYIMKILVIFTHLYTPSVRNYLS